MTQISITSSTDPFSIEIASNRPPVALLHQEAGATGRIVVGDFIEIFYMDLSYWSVDDYKRSWRDSIQVIIDEKEKDSCLVASITDPKVSNFIFCWPLYRRGQDVIVQNSIIFLDELEKDFNPFEPWSSVRSRLTVDEDGNSISEWRVRLSAVRDFVEQYREL
ncbi:hypothetical protein [Nocardiopsis ansamitocini]|uniref:CdiI C-terminal domain-containing protein n=1 Tax=Nocardiopsis ansamitocini TaxID=1670832 RepID=A0A9W6UH65_9ACTN|nr:hypothetical protein [Nocardiopsis ansamitocini]GLU45650.1 hypothetical protein Nans01_00010 [Nocardiopsis ansamitocini]